MKVLLISNGSPLSAGGPETRCLELARNLVKLNSKVVIIAGKTKNHYKNEMVVDGVRIYHVNIVNFLSDTTNLHLYLTHLLFPAFSVFKIIKVIREFKPDIIDDSITTSSIPFPSIAPFFKANEKNEILVFGRLVAHKNHKTLIRAMTLIKDVKLRIIGEGPLKNNLIRLSKRLGIRDRIVFDGY